VFIPYHLPYLAHLCNRAASTQYIEYVSGIAGVNDIPQSRVYVDNIIKEMIQNPNPSPIPIVTQFTLENIPNAQSSRCASENRPPGGLLIVNPSGQRLQFSINSLTIVLASTVFIYQPTARASNITDIFVLEGSVQVSLSSNPNVTISGTSGQVIRFNDNPSLRNPLDLVSSGGELNWCQALYDLAGAVYQPFNNGEPIGIPKERLDFCQYAPIGGYPAGISLE
jgi:hypothetical protein